MYKDNQFYIAHGPNGAICINGKMANRHGLIAGATGTGKTVSLQVMAESFCQAGVPCFMADIKGDLSGISQPGKVSSFIEKRIPEFGLNQEELQFEGCPVRFYDVFGKQGHPMRTRVSNMGPLLLSRLLGLNDVQSGVLTIVFKVADERGLLLDDLKDLRAMLDYVAKHAAEYTIKYGNVSSSSVGAIQRSLLTLEDQGGANFFGEPSFDIFDLIATEGGKGVMNVLAADELQHNPKLYSTFLLWLLSEIYTKLPEVGDMPQPKLIFFFDEAHMLFDDTPKALVDKIEQVIRLMRSKGVGIYFITQSPADLPEIVLGQLGNRIQHALRAYTPRDIKAVKVAAETFRANPNFETTEAISNLETGEALVSFLDEKGAPAIVERAKILFPLSQIGPIDPMTRNTIINRSMIYGKYDELKERDSAFEILLAQSEKEAKEAEEAAAKAEAEEQAEKEAKEAEKKAKEEEKENKKPGFFSKIWKAIVTAITATIATILGNKISNTITGKKERKSSTSTTGKIVKNATTAATRTITRDILGNLVK